jgi:hypothetical protein
MLLVNDVAYMMFILYFLSLCLCFVTPSPSATFQRKGENLVMVHPDLGSQPASSVLQCSALCLPVPACQSFVYQPTEGVCQRSSEEGQGQRKGKVMTNNTQMFVRSAGHINLGKNGKVSYFNTSKHFCSSLDNV